MAASFTAHQSATLNTTSRFLIHFAQIHESFRKPEIDSLAVLHRIPIHWIEYSDLSPFALVSLPSRAAAAALIRRSILAKGIYSLWGLATTYPELHHGIQSRLSELQPPCMGRSFKFTIESYQHRRSAGSQRDLIESFAYLGFDGPIRMRDPELHFCIFEEFALAAGSERSPLKVAFGLFVSEGSRKDIETFDLKKRVYIGTTSMDAELALITGNMALSRPGKLVYDPFVGTGSFVVACSHQGASTIGSDIDGRQIRGKKGRNVVANFKQYGLTSRYLDGFVADLTNTPLRKGRYLDAIVCDPPYGVREGLKVLGHRDPSKNGGDPVVIDGVTRYLQDDYVPPKRPYSFDALLGDILQFAVDHLVPGGRLCFWTPTANEDCRELAPPRHPLLELVSVCPQQFNKWSRWLLTYERKEGSRDIAAEPRRGEFTGRTADELNDFRKKYFEGFASNSLRYISNPSQSEQLN